MFQLVLAQFKFDDPKSGTVNVVEVEQQSVGYLPNAIANELLQGYVERAFSEDVSIIPYEGFF
jgi:hypothetical protein